MTEPAVVVVGAGAAGLMAAIHSAEAGPGTLVFEGSADGGRKILISGGGRCNVLPSELDPRRFVTESSRPTMTRLLRSWPLAEQRAFFETELGVPLELEAETGKLFPRSNKARDVRDALVRAARARGAEVRFGARITGIEPEDGGWSVRVAGGHLVRTRRVILATGGQSVPNTGSDGAGFAWVRRLGHTVHDLYPALTPLRADPTPHAGLSGVSLTVRLEAVAGAERAEGRGGFLFTHHGYSGPAVLDVSHVAVRSRQAGGSPAMIRVQWTGESVAEWDQRLKEQTPELALTVLRRALPARLVDVLLAEAGVAADRTLSQLKREERRALVEVLAAYPLPWTGDEGYKKAEVTGGGVALSEVDPGTLESRKCPGLFLSGEMLDAFGPIGGHNFAWAWATGRLAGRGAATA